jgi:hypothetical protein
LWPVSARNQASNLLDKIPGRTTAASVLESLSTETNHGRIDTSHARLEQPDDLHGCSSTVASTPVNFGLHLLDNPDAFNETEVAQTSIASHSNRFSGAALHAGRLEEGHFPSQEAVLQQEIPSLFSEVSRDP